MDKCKEGLRGFRKPFNYWYPNTNIIHEIVRVYGKHIRGGDIIVISEKALCVAKGNIYDEKSIKKVDPFTKVASYMVNKFIWGKLLKSIFPSKEIMRVVQETPINIVATHKKLALRYGGPIHFLKPYSEVGIDATNLPYMYVSLPLKNASIEAEEIRIEISRRLRRNVNVLIIDTDRTFKLRWINSMAISTRPSSISGIVDLGGLGYIIGKIFDKIFTEYPTPIAYDGTPINLTDMLKITRFADKMMGYGFGRNILDMLSKLGKKGFEEVKWMDMLRIKHYPVVIVRFREYIKSHL